MGVQSFMLILAVLVRSLVADVEEHVVVKTRLGSVKGIKRINKQTGETVNEFRGIPYGKPPVGALRFQKPEAADTWQGTFDATTFGAACLQNVPEDTPDWKPAKMSEDCLYLNVYVPRNLNQADNISVMVWIHGGGLQLGFAHAYDGGWIATEGNVIVVTINYRLNVFGFLATEHPAIRGNFGLWDQKLALQWVHDNIESFGGNPESVTVFGESAGGWSTSIQSLIPSNDGLFQRIITQSGVADTMIIENQKSIKQKIDFLAEGTDCPSADLNIFAKCLRGKTVEELLNITVLDYVAMPSDRVQVLGTKNFFPAVDGELIKLHPLKQLENKTSEVSKFYASLDVISGTTSNEGSLLLLLIRPQVEEHYGFNISDGMPNKFVCDGLIAPYVELCHDGDLGITSKICDFYTVKDRGTHSEQARRATEFVADTFYGFGVPTVRLLERHTSLGGRTYHYVFYRISDDYNVVEFPIPEWFSGCPHAEDLMYLFDMEQMFPSRKTKLEFTDEIKNFSRQLIQYWTSFAKTGVPNGGEGAVEWKQFDLTERNYLDIDIPFTLQSSWNIETIEFWNQISRIKSDPKDTKDHDEL